MTKNNRKNRSCTFMTDNRMRLISMQKICAIYLKTGLFRLKYQKRSASIKTVFLPNWSLDYDGKERGVEKQ